MATYRYLLSEKQFLRVQLRAQKLANHLGYARGTNLERILYKDNELVFETHSYSQRDKVWVQRVRLVDVTEEQILNAKSFNVVEKLVKDGNLKISCNCLAEGTRILTKDGFKEIQNVQKGDQVLSSDGCWHRVEYLSKTEGKSNWVEVKFRGKRDPLIITTDHEVLLSSYRDLCACGCGGRLRPSSEKNRKAHAYQMFHRRRVLPKHSKRSDNDGFQRFSMKPVSTFKWGELFCAVKSVPEQDFDVDYARMLGYYLAEGSVCGNVVTLTLNQNEECTIAADIENYFTSKGVKVLRKKCFYKTQKWLVVRVYSKQYKDDCLYYCGKGSRTKTVHTDVLNWSKNAKVSFLIGHLLGDGAVDDSFRWLSTSKDLIDMVSILLNTIGVHASTYISEYNTDKLNSASVHVASCALNKFYPFYKQYLHLFRGKDIVTPNNSRGQNDVDEFVLYSPISVKEATPRIGYDIHLSDEPHNYVANGLIVSNCPAFLYWGFKYKAWKRGYGLEKETRFPKIRNPFQRGYVCKHLYLVMQTFPFLSKQIASKLVKYYKKGEEDDKLTKNSNYFNIYSSPDVTKLFKTKDSLSRLLEELKRSGR